MLMVQGNSMGTNWKGHYTTDLLDVYARGRLTRADDLSETVKVVMLLGQYMQEHYHGRYYAKAQNLARGLNEAYNDALKDVDLLVMPTTPMKAPTAGRTSFSCGRKRWTSPARRLRLRWKACWKRSRWSRTPTRWTRMPTP